MNSKTTLKGSSSRQSLWTTSRLSCLMSPASCLLSPNRVRIQALFLYPPEPAEAGCAMRAQTRYS